MFQLWLDKEDDLLVFGFEPEPNSIECIKTGIIDRNKIGKKTNGNPFNKKFLEDNRFILLPYAVDNVDKLTVKKMYIEDGDVGVSSLYEFSDSVMNNFKLRETIDVNVINLKMFFDIFPWDRFPYIDFLKIDTQGADLNVLKSAGSYLKDRVVYVTVEADGHQYSGSDAFTKNIVEYMTSQDFIYINHYNTNDPTFLNKKYQHLKNKIFIIQNN